MGLVMAASDVSWPEAAVWIAGTVLVGAVIVVVVWQVLATWRTRIATARGPVDRIRGEQTAREPHERRGGAVGADDGPAR